MAANGAFLMRLLRLIWRILVGVKDALVLLFMLLFFGALYAALAGRAATVVPSEAALTLDLDGVIVDQPAEQPPLALLRSEEHTADLHSLMRIWYAVF